MLSPDLKGAFIRVPKTASTTVVFALRPTIYIRAHITYEALLAKFLDHDGGTQEEWNSLFKFSFVRNPWDRYVSFYFHDMKAKSKSVSVENFRAYIRNAQIDPNKLRTNPGSMFENADLDFVGQFENLALDLNRIQHCLGVERRSPGHEKKSIHRPTRGWCDLYDDETRAIVEEAGSWEIERFGYTFEACV